MKYYLIFIVILFCSCEKKKCYRCEKYPAWLDTVTTGKHPVTGKTINIVEYQKEYGFCDWKKKDALNWEKANTVGDSAAHCFDGKNAVE